MRKEVSVAIIIGVVLGAIILYGITLANKSASSLPKTQQIATTPIPTVEKEQAKSNSLTFNNLVNNQVVFEKQLTLTGKTTPNTTISIIWEEDEVITVSDESGSFSQKINLIPGENIIKIDILTKGNILDSQLLKLVYSTKPIE